jgi:hypothetical protein
MGEIVRDFDGGKLGADTSTPTPCSIAKILGKVAWR